jgi:phosphopantothenoylcysteine synthetase/decarboxylase
MKAIEKNHCDYVVANTLQNRYDKVFLISLDEKIEIFKGENEHIEELLVKEIAAFHGDYMN